MQKTNLNVAIEIYDKLRNWKDARKLLKNHFAEHNENSDFETVLIKVILIDSLYKTNLKKQIDVARHILNKNIDVDLKDNKLTAISKICEKDKNGEGKDILSFASKYCHFHKGKQDVYPIYDSYVIAALKDEKLLSWKEDQTRNYELFVKAIKDFIELNSIDCDFEKADTYLWIYGQKLKLDKYGEKSQINKEIKKLYFEERELFNRLV